MKIDMKKVGDILLQAFILSGCFYAPYELFFVFRVPGQSIVLFQAATQIDPVILMARRLYAIEFWIIFIAYLVYLGQRKKIWNLS